MIKRNIPGYVGFGLIILSLVTNIVKITDGVGEIYLKGYELNNIIICSIVSLVWVVLSSLKQKWLSILPWGFIAFEMIRMLNEIKELSLEYGEVIKEPSFYLIFVGVALITTSTIMNAINKDKKKIKNDIA